MDNQFFLNAAGIPPSLLHPPPMAAWPHQQQLSSAMEVQVPELNHCSSSHQSPVWEKSLPDRSFHFDSALSSIVSSPAASNSNLTNDGFVIRELIGKLAGNSSTVAEFAADPGFAERAARFSCFGSRSFSGRTTTTTAAAKLTNEFANYRSHLSMADQKLSRVSSSPSLKVLGSETNLQEHKNNNNSPPQEEEQSSLSNPSSNPRKRKAVTKAAKLKEPVAEDPEKASPKKSKAVETKENVKSEEDSKKISDGNVKANSKPPEPPKDYIHVRARRGQATDSHSLAERVRREKISERMKLLQDLVPGCNKVTGKALMLDEIINYVQSLQHQVEFLSMKLASVNTTTVDFNMDSLVSKQMYQSSSSLTHAQISPIDSSASTFYGHQNPSHCSVDPLDSVFTLNPFPQNQNHPQFPSFGEDELQSIVQMGFLQNQTQEISLQSHNFNLAGSDQMKIEL